MATDGTLRRKSVRERGKRRIDCFHVYPTTSLDPTMLSNLILGKDEELLTAYMQAARFRTQCRVFAPLYRQNTVTALHAAL